ncbi:efflux RND transporter periplasmic adaptor subunit [Pseudomonas seleniipraecipitans]|uniref:Efflux RND transporter periplasmic adaptor subunit n=1 Tax=Phytopseudomonas seleniipraecipitans TaxID=640205 RepID=A0ABY5J650_9GAMM|nr:efflux RND transporter periplasmic adaptor subunit [Pseudomonas seleniipraecipitans]UUD63095.1 efflux RND transporter periplasmic adaptor subunit [Pseudomonas seleniipraecipitans]
MNRYCRSTLGALVLISLAACGEHSDTSEPVAEQSQASDKRTTSVNVAAVERRQLQAWVYSQGTARSRQREFLTFTQQGVVSYVDPQLRVGMPVKTGQVIAHQAPERVEADLQAAKASLAEAQASLKLAEVTQTRYEKLIEQRSASQQELDEARVQVQQARAVRDNARAELAQAQLSVDESRLVSPMNGVLARLNIEKGRYFMPNTVQADTEQNALRTVPALVIDPDRFEVRVDLPSYNFRQIETGAQAVIGENPSVAGQDVDPLAVNTRVEGQVYAVSPSLDPETRTFEVIVHTRNNETGLQDGEFVAVWIAEPSVDDALVVPLAALRFRNDQAFVFVANEEKGTVSERRVELAQQSGDYRAVASGLETGELVVTEGRAALNDGQQVRIIHAGENAP